MTNDERFETALIQVQNGHTITQIIQNIYGTWRHYQTQTTLLQRASLSRARREAQSQRVKAPKKRYPRLFVDTTPERKRAVEEHCRRIGIPIARFVNSAVAEALKRAQAK